MWKDICNNKGEYQWEINEEGSVRSKDIIKVCGDGNTYHFKSRPLKIQTTPKGYKYVRLGSKDKSIHYIHRLLYKAFIGDIPEGMEIDHKDRDPSNNSLDNLRAVDKKTQQMNRITKYKPCINKRDNGKFQIAFSMFGKYIVKTFETYDDALVEYDKLYNERINEYKKCGYIL